jgi:hypothetical protein
VKINIYKLRRVESTSLLNTGKKNLIMQSISKYPLIRILLALLTVGLISTAIALELLPEDLAKVYVIPVLVSALFTSVAQASIYKKY